MPLVSYASTKETVIVHCSFLLVCRVDPRIVAVLTGLICKLLVWSLRNIDTAPTGLQGGGKYQLMAGLMPGRSHASRSTQMGTSVNEVQLVVRPGEHIATTSVVSSSAS